MFYSRAIEVLARVGLAKPSWRPPLAHARAVAPARPDVASPLAGLAALYYRLRFARRALSPAESEQAGRLLGELEAAVRKSQPAGSVEAGTRRG
jgi:hypothetical protein